LRDFSVAVARGECVSVIGPNGTGKSTLLRIAAGELQPDRGHVSGIEAARIGFLRQSPDREVERTSDAVPALAMAVRGDAMLAEAAAALATADTVHLAQRERDFDAVLAAIGGIAERETIEVAAREMAA